MLLLIMRHIEAELRRSGTAGCRERAKDLGELFRLDAKAEGNAVAIGGWRTANGARAWDAPWFAVDLTRVNAPWAFARGEPFRTIASLELLGVLVGVMVLLPQTDWARDESSTGFVTFGCGTDNQSNSYLMDKLMTTKFPLGAILMELAHQLSRRRAVLRARWLPRLQNEEADSLTNGDFRHFNPENRIPVSLETLQFGVLDGLLEEGQQFYTEVEEQRAAEKVARRAAGPRPPRKARKKAGDALRDRDPW